MGDTFGPINAGIVQRQTPKADPKVVAFPGKTWRDERAKMLSSTDPIDVAISFDPKSLHREVDRRVDARDLPATSSEDSGTRLQTFTNSIAKASRKIGLIE
jgi:hypothetical protein